MLTIRMARQGSKKRPHYRIVVSDSSSARGGRVVELVGTYEPRRAEASFNVNKERVEYWISKGAHATDTVRSLLEKVHS